MFENIKSGPTINLNLNEIPLADALARTEQQIYKFAIEHAKFNQSKAALLIGVSRGTMRYKLQEFFPGVYY
jgi:DNA-binding protein Fis